MKLDTNPKIHMAGVDCFRGDTLRFLYVGHLFWWISYDFMHLQQVQRGGRFSPFDPFPSTEQDFLHVVFEKRVPFGGFVHTKTFTFQDDILF